MDHIPVELIGKILSGVGAARDVVIASATCRKWQQAYCQYVDTLSFNSNDWPSYLHFDRRELEFLILKTIFHATGLRCLSILIDGDDPFSEFAACAWILCKRDMLHELHFSVRKYPIVNILELESVECPSSSILVVKPRFHILPCLKSLSLSHVSVSLPDLNLVLSLCPKIESFELIKPWIETDGEVEFDMEELSLSSPTLKSIYVDNVSVYNIIVEADCLEIIHLKDCWAEDIEIICEGTLRHFKLDGLHFSNIYVGENIESLEVVDISKSTMLLSILFKIISKSSSLGKLRIWDWDVTSDDEDEWDLAPNDPVVNVETVVNVEIVAGYFPKLSHLSLNYGLRDDSLCHKVQGSSYLTNVNVLELGWRNTMVIDRFWEWVESMLKQCPNLKKLVFCMVVLDTKRQCDSETLANFTSSMAQLMRSYMHVEVQYEFV